MSRRKMQNTVSSDWTDNSSLSVSEQPTSESSVIADAGHVARLHVLPISRGCASASRSGNGLCPLGIFRY